MINVLIALGLIIGLSSLIVHLLFITISFFSEEKWTIEIYYNKFHEGIIEMVFLIILIVFLIILLIMV